MFLLIPIGFRARMVCIVYLEDTGIVNKKYCKGDSLILNDNNKYYHLIKIQFNNIYILTKARNIDIFI